MKIVCSNMVAIFLKSRNTKNMNIVASCPFTIVY